jgi:hypothetical protein
MGLNGARGLCGPSFSEPSVCEPTSCGPTAGGPQACVLPVRRSKLSVDLPQADLPLVGLLPTKRGPTLVHRHVLTVPPDCS